MTFNQWFSTQPIRSFHKKLALEVVWNALIIAGHSPVHAGRMLSDLLETLSEDA